MHWLVLILALSACAEQTIADPTVSQDRVVSLAFDAHPATQLDVLVVVDDAPAMAPVQKHLATAFQQIAGELDLLASGGAPDLHVGVITGDLCARTDVAIPYLTDRIHAGRRQRSYTGTLADALGALANVGADGCDRPQLLEAMRRVLSSPANAGFLREHALLQVIFVTDEDDASDDDPQAYLSYLRALSARRPVMATGVLGPCDAGAWSAGPADRLRAVIERLPNSGETLPICSEDLSDAVCVISRFEPEWPGEVCLNEPLGDVPVCTMSDVQRRGGVDQAEQVIAACDGSGVVPCWHVVADNGYCGLNRALRIDRGDLEIPFHDTVVANCLPR